MPQIKETLVFDFSELSECAKDRARNWYREGALDYEWWDCVFDDFAVIAELIGIDLNKDRGANSRKAIYFSGFYSQGDGASFEGSYSYRKGALKAVKAHAPMDEELHKIVAALQDVQRTNFYQLYATISRSGRYHSLGVSVDREGYTAMTDGAEDAVEEAMRDLAHWLFLRLESEYEYLNSEEQVDEAITANEYTFDEEGSRQDS